MSLTKGGLFGIFPFPPSVNSYYACVRGRKIMSKKGREYAKLVMAAAVEQGLAFASLNGRLSARLVLHPPTRRRLDISNFVKALEDGLTKAEVWEDDSQIDRWTIVRGEVRKGGEAHIEIVEIKDGS